jgi:hypothetical protein
MSPCVRPAGVLEPVGVRRTVPATCGGGVRSPLAVRRAMGPMGLSPLLKRPARIEVNIVLPGHQQLLRTRLHDANVGSKQHLYKLNVCSKPHGMSGIQQLETDLARLLLLRPRTHSIATLRWAANRIAI